MDAELQINPSDTDDDLFGSKSPPPKKSSRQSPHSQSSRSQSSKRLRSTIQIPQPREHSRTSSLSEPSPTSSRSHVHSPPHTRTSVRHRHRSHRHESRRDRSPRQQSQHPSTASPRQRTHGKSPRPESNIKQWTVVRLQRALKDKGINFSRYDNKSRLFQLYTASINTPLNVNTEPSTLPPFARNPPIVTRDVTTQPSHRPRQAAPAPPSQLHRSSPPSPAIPHKYRRTELDDYLYIILDMAVRFGGNGFYNYHVFFATQAAGRLQQFNQGTYWGTLDTELCCRIFAARTSLSCELCGAPSHPASMCTVVKPQSSSSRQTSVFNRLSSAAPPPSIIPKPLDIRPTVNVPIPKNSYTSAPSLAVPTPGTPAPTTQLLCREFVDFITNGLQNGFHPGIEIKPDPDREFVDFITNGLQNGFHPGIEIKPDTSHISPNLQSALSEPNTVDTLMAKEVQEGFMIGPFKEPPFSPFRISPVGIATRKYSGKKRLIIDLSSPHGSHIPSINSIIPAPDFSMKYASIDQAISLIRKAGLGAWLSKADITSAFKVMPIHPEFWRFFGIFWKGAYYFAVRLTFGCKSSPKIFDSLSEALCWILINNHKLPYVLHLLDDFLIITPPSTPPSLGLSTLVQVFNELGVPLSKEKTLGPCTSIEFLGITLDSISFQASLPSEKVQRISLLLSNYLLADRCTKQQLLALLGHLNYAIRIIPQGKSFLSHLLSKVTSIPSLHDKVTLDEGCKMEMHLWQQFLSSWNGISFFYNDYVSQPEDIQLYTDAAPSTGFGGYYSGRWFASEWPPEFSHLAQQSDSPSSTLFEIYPVIIAAILWGHEWSKHIILIHSDNSAVVDIINKGRSRSPTIMQFIRRLTLISAQNQFLIRAAHIPEVQDLGSRLRRTSHASSTVFCYHLQLNPHLEDLSHASREAILDGLAPSTLSAYLTGWNCFKAYHSYYQIPFPLLDVWSICNFVTHAHSNLNIRASTIQTYLSRINFILKLATGEPCHSISHSHVTMLIKGLRKQEPASSARRLPLTSDLLSQCICTLRSGYMSPPIDRMLECMFLLAFFGFLRCSELAPSTSAFNPVIHPSLSDISVHTPDSLIYTLKKSKTDQFGKSCPIYIFRLNSFIRVLSASGISPEHYSLHSFRIGAATTAASAGISDETIRVMGRWSSEAYRLYIRNNLNDLLQAQAHISSFKPLGVF
ncbi:hypothetical protein M9458_056258 [Cirrhinus mrigala]|uniref:ribonuclease H n=1 Tax=Cirrhinus mrigala TaxID=683832 RepID=A0ABD0MDT0_CIRMR